MTNRASKSMTDKEYHQKWRDAQRERDRACKARWRKNNRERIRLQAKKYRQGNGKAPTRAKDLRVKYGMTPEQYDTMLRLQNHQCAICGKTPAENGKRLAIDHCHKTTKVRGLLCYRCNTGLASFKDELTLILNAVTYLQQAIAKAEGES